MLELSKKMRWEIAKKTFLPLLILFTFIASYMRYNATIAPMLSAQLKQQLNKYIGTIFILCIAFVIQRVLTAIIVWYKENIIAKTATQLDDKLVPILHRTIKVAIWAIALLVILPLYGVNITALIAALGVSSLAIALAAQDTIANIIAGFLILIDVPFKIGDKIKLPSGEIVEVLDIGVRRSRFLSEDKAIIIVPNVDLSKSRIINYTFQS